MVVCGLTQVVVTLGASRSEQDGIELLHAAVTHFVGRMLAGGNFFKGRDDNGG